MFRLAIVLALSVFAGCPAVAAPLEEKSYPRSPALEEVATAADRFAEHYPRSKILVVFDVDDTLLTSTKDFGSHAWFKWQHPMAKTGKGEHRVADTPQALYALHALAYAIGDMKKTQPNTHTIVKSLIEKGHPVMALTARGPINMSATLRELTDQTIAFPTAPTCTGGICQRRGWITAEIIRNVAAPCCGFNNSEKAKLLKSPRAAAYDNGVMMLAGQDKGLFLRMLLAATPTDIKAVVFADDSWKNIKNTARAFRPLKDRIALKALYYTKLSADQQDFLASKNRQRKAAETWQAIKVTLCRQLATQCSN